MDLNRISDFIDRALAHMAAGAKEAVLTSNFSSFLRSMFPESPLWVEHYFNGIENAVTLYRSNTAAASSGSIDVFVNGTVIEFERNLSHSHIYNHGFDQVKDYCAAKIRSGVAIDKLIGVLSDTLTWEFYVVNPIPGLPPSAYTSSNISLSLVHRIQINSSDHTQARQLGSAIETYFGRIGARTLSATNLYNDFGIDTPLGARYLADCSSYINSLSAQKPAYYTMIQQLWESFVEGLDKSITTSNDSYTIEFYIATLAKLLCANIFESRALLSTDAELIELISGQFFLRKGYLNFIEYDYFGWINEHIPASTFLNTLRAIQEGLSIYDYSVIPDSDIFGNLLTQLSLKTKRILLGQELTPSWLSTELVNSVYQKLSAGTWPRFIDMCCGSGSMIVSTIELCASLLNNSTLNDDDKYSIIENCALGIDIDPLAVLLAKVNWIIHTKSFCQNKTEIIIPVYHADSLFISSPVTSGTSSYTLSFDGHTVNLPGFLLDSQHNEFFSILIERITNAIDTPTIDARLICNSISLNTHNSFSSSEQTEVETFTNALHSILFSLHTNGRNGIWSFLLKNSFKPALITRRFNGIVSNTPWMALSQVTNNPYKDSLNAISRSYNIFPGDSSSLHSEIATVFLLHSIDCFLEDGGVYGCILPRSVMNGKQHDKFRINRLIPGQTPFAITPDELWDLPQDTFNNRAIALFGSKQSSCTHNSGLTSRIYSLSTNYSSGRIYINNLNGRVIWSTTSPSTRRQYSAYSFKQGADIMPRTLFYFDLTPIQNNFEIKPLIPMQSPYSFFLKDAKDPYKSYIPSSARIPKEFFKQTIVSNVVLPFKVCDTPLALIPYTKDTGNNHWRSYSAAEIAALPAPVSSTLSKLSRDYKLLKKANKELYGNQVLDIYGKLTQQSFSSGKYLVLCGAGGSNIAASFLKLDDVNNDVIVDQTLYYLQVETEDEAIYLTGLLNSNILNQTIKAYQPSGIKGERHVHTIPYQYIPRYDSTIPEHAELVLTTLRLIHEIDQLIASGSANNMINANAAPLSTRRKGFTIQIEQLPSYLDYERCCCAIII